jgi:hypothetical protein
VPGFVVLTTVYTCALVCSLLLRSLLLLLLLLLNDDVGYVNFVALPADPLYCQCFVWASCRSSYQMVRCAMTNRTFSVRECKKLVCSRSIADILERERDWEGRRRGKRRGGLDSVTILLSFALTLTVDHKTVRQSLSCFQLRPLPPAPRLSLSIKIDPPQPIRPNRRLSVLPLLQPLGRGKDVAIKDGGREAHCDAGAVRACGGQRGLREV